MLFLTSVLLTLWALLKTYPKVVVKGQSFKGNKKWTIPSQALSLAEIIRRYLRHEPLPSATDGVYETRFGDLEKIARLDIVEQLEHADELKAKVEGFKKSEQEKIDAAEKLRVEELAAFEKQRFNDEVEKAIKQRTTAAGAP